MTCPRTIFGRPACRFEARYEKRHFQDDPTYTPITGRPDVFLYGVGGGTKTVYVRDVCVKCGKTIEREGK
jgi:hypothetical protein